MISSSCQFFKVVTLSNNSADIFRNVGNNSPLRGPYSPKVNERALEILSETFSKEIHKLLVRNTFHALQIFHAGKYGEEYCFCYEVKTSRPRQAHVVSLLCYSFLLICLVISAGNLMMLCSLTGVVSKIRKTYDMLCSVTLRSILSMRANSRVSLDFTPSIFLEITCPWYGSGRKCSTKVILVDDKPCRVPCVIRICYSYL